MKKPGLVFIVMALTRHGRRCRNTLAGVFSTKKLLWLITAGMLLLATTCEEGMFGSLEKLEEQAIEENQPRDITNAQKPEILEQPKNASYSPGATAANLFVTASVDDGGTLGYQWYKNSENSISGGEAIEGAAASAYNPVIPPTISGSQEITYYWVVVTNTNNSVNGLKTATTVSDIAVITVTPIVDAQTPEITIPPAGANYNPGATAAPLSVTAAIGDGGTLSYQWYMNTQDSTTEGSIELVASVRTYTPDTTQEGTLYYFVVVTNTNDNVNGIKTASVTSSVVAITVDNLVHAETPTITTPPVGANYNVGEIAEALSVTASVTDGGTLSYQWYRNTSASTSGAATVGSNSSSYTPSTSTVGDLYYYVVVTNTNNSVSGSKTATVMSGIVMVTVNRKPVTIIGVSVENKTYNGNRTADITPGTADFSPGSILLGDTVTISYGTALFDNKNVGNGKTVTFSGFNLGGQDAGKYILSAQPVNTTANITHKTVSINGVKANNKVYDGNTSAVINTVDATIPLLESGDIVTISGTGTFDLKDVGSRTVSFSGFSLGGTDGANYTVAPQPSNVTANITAKGLSAGTPSRTLIPINSADALYGTTTVVPIIGIISGDTVSISVGGSNAYGLSGSASGVGSSGSLTITYDGTTEVAASAVSVPLTVSGNINYNAAATAGVVVWDGQAVYRDTGVDRRIAVTPTNITAFNTYARTSDGLTRHYKLMDNITLTATTNNWTAIGASGAGNYFIGSFDGQGHTITGLNINRSTFDYQGMFGYVDGSLVGGGQPSRYGEVKNLGFIGGSVTGKDNVGFVAGYICSAGPSALSGTISNCYVTGPVSGASAVGGLVGYNDGNIRNCYTTGNVTGSGQGAGGIAGENRARVDNCYASGSVTGNDRSGGIVGNSQGMMQTRVVNCVALNTNVSSSTAAMGRVAGRDSSLTMLNNYARAMTIGNPVSSGLNTIDGQTTPDGSIPSYTTLDFWWVDPMGPQPLVPRWNGSGAWDFGLMLSSSWDWSTTKQLPVLRGIQGQD